jgi:tetratricopeptide (TPR) repeat protein
MPGLKLSKVHAAFLVLVLSTALLSATGHAQSGETAQDLKQRADALLKQNNYLDALPFLEKLVVATPDDPDARFSIGFSLLAKAQITKDAAERKALRVRARNAFLKAKDLHVKQPVVDALIQSLPVDGADGTPFSKNPEANDIMNQAESLFSQGNLDQALASYQKALQLDPKLYDAALFTGDVYTQKGDFAQAEVWYQKAIAIDPYREIAYRYSATPLMKQHKYDQARDRYVESFITEPYGRFGVAGLTQWAQATKATLANPRIDNPSRVTFDEKGEVKITLENAALTGSKDDGSFAWIAYGGTRSLWHKEKFARSFPDEKAYRHSLPEEAEALRTVISAATAGKGVAHLSPTLATLKKLNDAGLLEPYILLAIADDGIVKDYPAYLRTNRDKLRRYVLEYVISGSGT